MRISRVVQKTILAILIMIFIVIAFLVFTYRNRERILEQNMEYIGDAARQKAQRLEYILRDTQKNFYVFSELYEWILAGGTGEVVDINQLAEAASFDYMEYADRSGVTVNAAGEKTDISDREYFIRGMRGESGMMAVIGSRLVEGNPIMFYAPLKINGEIVGVFMGLYGQEKIEELLNSAYFGEQARAYLCARDGRIVACSAPDEEMPDNIIDFYEEKHRATSEALEHMKQALAGGESEGFRYHGKSGTGTAYITGVNNTDLMIFQELPSVVTERMIRNANAMGAKLSVNLLVALAVYIVVILIMDYRQRRKLVWENTEMSYVIAGTTKLFDRFIFVDLEQETYRYLAGTYRQYAPIMPEGEYVELAEYLTSMMVDQDERERMAQELDLTNLRSKFEGDIESLSYEYFIHRDKELWERLNVICVERRDGKAAQVLFARQDVTEFMSNELKKNAALSEAFQAAEMANQAKSDFLSRMSHDIRTPMNAIMGMTSIAEMNIQDTAKVADCLNKINISSKHLLGLINEVLDMSKIESGKLVLVEEVFSIPEVVDNLKSIFFTQIKEKNQNLNIAISNVTHERVIGDAQRLQQVFVNIMGNAVKFTPNDGDILLEISEKEINPDTGSALYEFVFTDSGIGMESDFLEHLFEPFTRANDSRIGHTEGTGLGMSIAKSIVQMMNGDIRVKSSPGEGSQFTVSVYLQLCNEEDDNLDALAGLPVLVADDEQFECESVCETLRSIGMKADWVTDGDLAIQKLLEAKEKNEDYAVMILDWKMPGKDGLQTAIEVREKLGRDIPIIILSAYDWSAIEQEARAAGVSGFVSKPLFRTSLVRIMRKLIEKKQDVVTKNPIAKKYEGKRALLAEDNALNTEIAVAILKMAGFSVDTACDGVQALRRISETEEYYYDVVFMDIQMPNMDGYEASRAIRKLDRPDTKNLPIIAMSANAFADDIRKAKESGMNTHVAKPIDIKKLMAAIDEWIT